MNKSVDFTGEYYIDRKVLSHEIVLPMKVFGQGEVVAPKLAGLHLVFAKVTTATTCVLGTIAQRSQ